MRLDVYFHQDPGTGGAVGGAGGFPQEVVSQILHAVRQEIRLGFEVLNRRFIEMSTAKLDAALAAIPGTLGPIQDELAALKIFIQETVPSITGAAVADALAAQGLTEDAAATAINTAMQQVRDGVQTVFDSAKLGTPTQDAPGSVAVPGPPATDPLAPAGDVGAGDPAAGAGAGDPAADEPAA